ncbi:TD and POZ domain-containing protein 3-like [Grammomys surdaster]|uniref:TD and POZ domain-containing protein 3-like n=1 Tax=Grammomys surdaster TaxID=491861 RepID=UPI0010A02CD4|nr:TD and POZ domain-containing protein 3-like [Grammomys surdaster]
MSGDLEAKSLGSTQISDHKFYYKWTISKFSLYMVRFMDKITSPLFSFKANEEVAWCLRVHPNGVDGESKDYLSVYLLLLSCPKSPVWAKFHFWITNNQREKYITMKSSNIVSFLHNQHRGFKKFMLREFLLSHRRWFLPEDQLTLYCKVSIVGDCFSNPGQNMTPAIIYPRHVFTDDVEEQWENSLSTDCCLFVGGQEFRAHKAILAAHSPVFRAMFEHEMKEKLTNRVEIQDLDPEVFKEMMGFIYTGKVPHFHSYSMTTGVLAAADRYGLEDLMAMCEDALCRNLSVLNVTYTLFLADLHSRKHLKTQALDFIKLYPFEVSETSRWKSMEESHPHLVAEVFHSLTSAQCPYLEPPLKRLKQS